MATLSDYHHFNGRHWETGTVHNYMAYRRFSLPHNDKAPGEALLMGISGGAVVGYFTFSYEGYDPQVNILTRNTFDPLDTLLSRLGVEQTIRHTNKPDRAREILLETLREGLPAIVWADPYRLPYNNLPDDDGMWGMLPVLVFAYDEESGTVSIADRARVPLHVTTQAFDEARSRVKKIKHRLLTLGPPDPAKLASAVHAGIAGCLRLYLEKPPKGAAHNFGLAALKHWAKMLTTSGGRGSWAKEFPPGIGLYAALTSAYDFINHFGKDDPAERNVYADFLVEAAAILDRPALNNAASLFRHSATAWAALSRALLPDDVPLLAQTRELKDKRHRLFLDQGHAALPQIQEIDVTLAAQRQQAITAFPLSDDQVTDLLQNIAAHVLAVHDIESEAVTALQTAMASK